MTVSKNWVVPARISPHCFQHGVLWKIDTDCQLEGQPPLLDSIVQIIDSRTDYGRTFTQQLPAMCMNLHSLVPFYIVENLHILLKAFYY
jgi:hypothetical protein